MYHGSWSTFSLVNIPFLTFRLKLFSLYVQIYYIPAICTKHPKFCILVFSLSQMFVGEGSGGRKHLNLQIFPGPWGKKCAALCLGSHHTKLRIANSLSHCFFLGETGTAKIDVNYKNLGWQITQDLFALGKSISELEQAVSLAGVVFQHGSALGLLYAKHGSYCITLGKLAVSIPTTEELSRIIWLKLENV